MLNAVGNAAEGELQFTAVWRGPSGGEKGKAVEMRVLQHANGG